MAFAGIDYPIEDHIRELDELDRIIMVDSLVTDINPQGNTVTPVITLNGVDVTLSTIADAARVQDEIAINRIGPVQRLQYQYSQNDVVRWYNCDLVIRPLDLGINILPQRDRVSQRGHANDPAVSILYDINPFTLPTDARVQNAIIQRLYIDAITGAQSITPVLVFDDGTTTSLAALTTATRTITEYSIGTTQRLRRVRLDGDFTNASIIIYDIELDLYISQSQRV